MGVHTSVYDANMQLPTTPDLLKQAGVKSLRYPGGSYADLYHWSRQGDVHARVGRGQQHHLRRARHALRRISHR